MSKNRVIGGFEDSFESASGAVSTAAKQTVKDFTNTAKGQITGSQASAQQPADSGTNEHGASTPAQTHPVSDKGTNEQSQADPGANAGTMTDDERKDFLSKLYGKSDQDKNPQQNPESNGASVRDMVGASKVDPNKGKSPEEIAKLEMARKQLHNIKYYQPLINRPKRSEEPVAEKLEREEQEEKFEQLEKDKKKMTPSINPIQKQGTAEAAVGVSG